MMNPKSLTSDDQYVFLKRKQSGSYTSNNLSAARKDRVCSSINDNEEDEELK